MTRGFHHKHNEEGDQGGPWGGPRRSQNLPDYSVILRTKLLISFNWGKINAIAPE